MNRGDRIAFLGDAYVAQATALAAFSKDTHGLLFSSLNYTKDIGNDIEPYWLMWVLSVLDNFAATGDEDGFKVTCTASHVLLEMVISRFSNCASSAGVITMG